MILILILIILAIFLSLIFFISNYVDYRAIREISEIDPITFKQFYAIFNVNQERWILHDGLIFYQCNSYKDIKIGLKTYWDWLKYQNFRRQYIKQLENKEKFQASLCVIKEWENDITKHEAKSKEELAQAENFLKEKYYNGI